MNRPQLLYCRQHPDPVGDAPAIRARQLTAGYSGSVTPALQAVDLDVADGERVALVGPNGSGKSTLLKVVAGLLPVAGGNVQIYGWPPGTCRHRVAYLPQRSDIDWRFPISLQRLVLTGRYVHLGWLHRPGRPDRALVQKVLDRLGLGPLAGRQIGELSGGQQQRALLARALVQEAGLLLLDEPLNAVDAETCHIVSDVLGELQRGGKTVVVATHDIEEIEGGFDRVVFLSEGRIVPAITHPLEHAHRSAAWAG